MATLWFSTGASSNHLVTIWATSSSLQIGSTISEHLGRKVWDPRQQGALPLAVKTRIATAI